MSDDDKPPREKASKIPSWIMLGFVLGALTLYTFNDYLLRQPDSPSKTESATITTAAAPEASPASTTAPVSRAEPDTATQSSPLLSDKKDMSLYAMDIIFRKWEVNAQWEYNTTQVVFWNPADGKYSVPVEVTRYFASGDEYVYSYRLLEQRTRPLTRESARSEAPVLFTESEEGTARRKEKDREAWFGN